MDEYKPNSHKYKESLQTSSDDKKVEKIVSGTVKTKKKSEAKKFADVFISEDVGNVKSYIFFDVLVPAIKKAISDIVTNGIDMILYGETGRGGKRSSASRISYDKKYERESDRRDRPGRAKMGYDYDDLIFDSRGAAEEILTKLDEIISCYGTASVADLYEMAGITGNYTDNKYGWIDIHNASVVRVRDGYMVKLPKALPLN